MFCGVFFFFLGGGGGLLTVYVPVKGRTSDPLISSQDSPLMRQTQPYPQQYLACMSTSMSHTIGFNYFMTALRGPGTILSSIQFKTSVGSLDQLE